MQAETILDAKLNSARLRFVLAVLLYGTIGPVVRFIALPSEVIVLFRGTFGSLFVWLFMRMRGQSLDRRTIRANLRWLVTSGICLGLNWIFLFAAYVHTTVAIASLCNYMAPIIVIALSPVVFGERIGPKRLACVVAAFVGIMLVSGVLGSGAAEVDLVGIALGLLAAAAFVGIVICNKKIVGVGAFDKVVVQLGTSAATVLPYALAKNGGLPLAGVDTRSWALLACICLVQTGIAYVFYFGAMGELPVTEIALLGYIEPVVSVLGSALFLQEPLGVAGAIGASMVIVAAAAGEVIRE